MNHASFFRAAYKGRDGERHEASKWYLEFRDHRDKIRRLPAFSDKKQSEELGRKIDKLVTCRANREAALDKAQREWLDSLPARLRSGLAKLGLVDSRSAAGSKALDNHVADFESALEAVLRQQAALAAGYRNGPPSHRRLRFPVLAGCFRNGRRTMLGEHAR